MDSEPLAQARAHLGEVVDRARHGGQAIVLTDHGKPAAVVISSDAYTDYMRLRDEDDQRKILAALEDPRPGKLFANADEMIRAADSAL